VDNILGCHPISLMNDDYGGYNQIKMALKD